MFRHGFTSERVLTWLQNEPSRTDVTSSQCAGLSYPNHKSTPAQSWISAIVWQTVCVQEHSSWPCITVQGGLIYVTWSPFCHQLGCRLSRVSSIYLRGTFDLPLHEDRYLFRLTFTWPWLVLSQVCPNTIVWPWPSTDLHPITSTRAKTSTHLLMWYICTVYVLLWNYTSQ